MMKELDAVVVVVADLVWSWEMLAAFCNSILPRLRDQPYGEGRLVSSTAALYW